MKDKNSEAVKGATYTTEASASATRAEEEAATPDPVDGAARFKELLGRTTPPSGEAAASSGNGV